MTPGSLDGETLRALVREVLADLLPAPGEPPAAEPAASTHDAQRPPLGAPLAAERPPGLAPAQPGFAHTVAERVDAVETISLRSDTELAAFVLRLLHMFENPKHRDSLRTGRLRFRLAPHQAPGAGQPAHRIEKGAVTEAAVRAAARAGARLVLGRRAVLTPLARDRARSDGVQIERERS